jgi:uncharacterized protein
MSDEFSPAEPRTSEPAVGRTGGQPEPTSDGARRVEELDTAQCWHLLEKTSLGRLAIRRQDGRPDVFPVNYLVHDGNVFIRSAPGTKLRSIGDHPTVAFEIDGDSTNFHWSVVVHAVAHLLNAADVEARSVLALTSASPTSKSSFLRLRPESVSGRRFPKRTRAGSERAPLYGFPPVEGRRGNHLKPDLIPSFPPLQED